MIDTNIHTYIHTYIDIWIKNECWLKKHTECSPKWLSPQWLCGNSCIRACDAQLHTAGTSEPKSALQANIDA